MNSQITFVEKINGSGQRIKLGQRFTIDCEKAKKAVSTNTIYIRIGFMNGTPFISQRGNGSGGAGDIISLNIKESCQVEVGKNLFSRLKIWADKNSLVN